MQLSHIINAQYVLSLFSGYSLPSQSSLRGQEPIIVGDNVNENSAVSVPDQATLGYPRAVVLWHGLGDNYNSSGMNRVTEIFENLHPGIFVHSVRLDESPSADQQKSLFGNANNELDIACKQLQNITELQSGFDIIGFSQGGVFARALIERCSEVSVHNLITFGSPHNGVSELPMCEDPSDWFCKKKNEVLKRQVWYDSVQKHVIPAQYFRDPVDYEGYLEHSNFLADINNERAETNATYKENFSKINKFVMILFDEDTTLVPKESAAFEDYDPVTGLLVPFEQTRLYREDLIGLRQLHRAGKVDFFTLKGDHMTIPDSFLVEVGQKYIGSPY
ncbi:Alpha/Beta hydrolase protein [Scheffersomyces xylosifermentans]|uniref:Alpha/Beta hydrolase protein n=1 Tax=Scheffersomyces xylosifermentans TaxID=1304137 RepID=UPI00315D55D0